MNILKVTYKFQSRNLTVDYYHDDDNINDCKTVKPILEYIQLLDLKCSAMSNEEVKKLIDKRIDELNKFYKV